jgi:hypothetical protein
LNYWAVLQRICNNFRQKNDIAALLFINSGIEGNIQPIFSSNSLSRCYGGKAVKDSAY